MEAYSTVVSFYALEKKLQTLLKKHYPTIKFENKQILACYYGSDYDFLFFLVNTAEPVELNRKYTDAEITERISSGELYGLAWGYSPAVWKLQKGGLSLNEVSDDPIWGILNPADYQKIPIESLL